MNDSCGRKHADVGCPPAGTTQAQAAPTRNGGLSVTTSAWKSSAPVFTSWCRAPGRMLNVDWCEPALAPPCHPAQTAKGRPEMDAQPAQCCRRSILPVSGACAARVLTPPAPPTRLVANESCPLAPHHKKDLVAGVLVDGRGGARGKGLLEHFESAHAMLAVPYSKRAAPGCALCDHATMQPSQFSHQRVRLCATHRGASHAPGREWGASQAAIHQPDRQG